MNRSKFKGLIIALVVVAATWGAYSRSVRIETWLWHLWHGTAVNVGSYVVPVPANWYVETQGDGGQLLVRTDTSNQANLKKLKAHSSILVFPGNPVDEADLVSQTSLDRAFLKKDGVAPILQRTLSVDGGTISCIGGHEPSSKGMYDVDPLSWRCKSSAGLQMTVGSTDADMGQVWEIILGIRKKSVGAK